MKCPECKGSGKIELATSVVTCDACGGTGKAADGENCGGMNVSVTDAVEGWAELLDVAAWRVHGEEPEGLGSIVAYARSQQPLKLPATFVRMADELDAKTPWHECQRLNSKPWRGHQPHSVSIKSIAIDSVKQTRIVPGETFDGSKQPIEVNCCRWRVTTEVQEAPKHGGFAEAGTGRVLMTGEQFLRDAYGTVDFNEYDFGELVPETPTVSEPHFKPVSLNAKPWIVTSYGCPE